MRALIYARYSSDMQSEASIDDQARLCRRRADELGATVLAVYSDEGISGSTPVADRPGGQAMLNGLQPGDLLIVEALDRISRSLLEQERIVRRLEHAGVRIIGVNDGYDTELKGRKLLRGIRGVLSEAYLEDLANRTHRGLEGKALAGLSAGGCPYGYRTVEADGGRRLQIREDQARWVRWIYQRFLAGDSPRSIAHELNRQGVPSPRGRTWTVSGIWGHPQKQTGILNNPIYHGTQIWNRSRWVKDPETGKRRRIERPESEWIIRHDPDLAIIDDATWQATRRRIGQRKGRTGPRPTTLLSGLLRCAHCGGAVVAVDARSYGCAAHKDRGPSVCTGIRVPRARLERRIIDLIRDDLLSPAAEQALRQEVTRLLRQQAEEHGTDRKRLENELRATEAEIQRLTDAIASAAWSEALLERLQKSERRRDEIRHQLAQHDTTSSQDAIRIIPRLMERYRALVDCLPDCLGGRKKAARDALLEILGEIRLEKRPDGVWAEIDTGALLLMVAGAGFEPATFGL